MEILKIKRSGLSIFHTGSLEPSQGSYDVPVSLENDDTYTDYTISMYVGYYVNGVLKKRKCETDSEGHYLIPGAAFLRSGIISISFLLETADKSQGLMTNALSYDVKYAPNVAVEIPPDPTWQELVKEWIKDIAGSVSVDNTLTQPGKAADAKATGDAISKLSDSIDDLKENGLNQNIDEAVANYLSKNPISGGLTSTAKNLLITILRNSLYSNNQSENITALETALGQSSSDTTVYYSITNTLTNVTNNNSNTQVLENTSYIASLSANNGYTLESITVTMGGIDITSSVYADGVITVSSVTGDIIITANAIISTTSNAELPTDGLIAYYDLRNLESGTDYDNASSGGKTTVTATTGDYWAYCWTNNSIVDSNEYGLQNANGRNLITAPIGTTANELSFAKEIKTMGALGYNAISATYCKSNNALMYQVAPTYTNEDGESVICEVFSFTDASNTDIAQFYDENGYITTIIKIQGDKLTYFLNGVKMVEYDGNTLDGFVSWNAENAGFNATSGRTTAIAYYSTEMTDAQVVDLHAYFKTLEVSA